MSTDEYAVEAVGLVKSFGETNAVDRLDMSVPVGGVVGLLGPNGAGKTTTVRMLATLLKPDDGAARVFGHDVVGSAAQVRGLIGLTGQFASIDDDLSGRENLVIQARLRGLSRFAAGRRADEMLEEFELHGAARRPVRTYSGGMQCRLDVATSLISPPKLLFLDEPTTGLDPRSRRQVWEVIRRLVTDGTTVLLTTQYLEEADQLAGRIVMLDHGSVVADGTPAQLKRSFGSGVLEVEIIDPARVGDAVGLLGEALGCPVEAGPSGLTVRAPVGEGCPGDRVTDALARLPRAGVELARFTLAQPSLDEVFLALTGRRATDHATEPLDQESA